MKRLKRSFKHFWQRIRCGFSDAETWSLDYQIAKFTLPRLRRFRQIRGGVPTSLVIKCGDDVDKADEEWDKILKEIEWYLETIVEFGEKGKMIDKEDEKRYSKAKKYWQKYFEDLWW